jgi:hypothetical protein
MALDNECSDPNPAPLSVSPSRAKRLYRIFTANTLDGGFCPPLLSTLITS